MCSLLGVLPQVGTPFNQKALASLTRGELLCQAFEVYEQLMPSHGISFEHAVFLVSALARGDELALSKRGGCGALIVSDRFAFGAPSCQYCGEKFAHLPTVMVPWQALLQCVPEGASDSSGRYHVEKSYGAYEIAEDAPERGPMQLARSQQVVSNQCQRQH